MSLHMHYTACTECLISSIMFQAFQDLLNGPIPRLEPQNTDVEPYVVDGVVYLARLWTFVLFILHLHNNILS